jgi:hypothetical protein
MMTKTVEQKNLEQRVKAALAANDVTSESLGELIAEVDSEVSQVARQVDLERAADINTDITVAPPRDNAERTGPYALAFGAAAAAREIP